MIYRSDEPSKAVFTSEAGLCKTFIWSLPEGWRAYPETQGFDIVLLRVADGVQVGIQAKMTLNSKVISQIVDTGSHWDVLREKPDYRAVLIPYGTTGSLEGIAHLLGITVIQQKDRPVWEAQKRWHLRSSKFEPLLPRVGDDHWNNWRGDWIDWCPAKRLALPDYVPDVIAGASGPTQLTDWKIKAIKLVILLERRGYVTREDFHHLQLGHRRWLDPYSGWLDRSETKGQWIGGAKAEELKRQHPINYEQIAADFDKWAPKPDLGAAP